MPQMTLQKNDRVKVRVLDRRQFTNKAIYEVEYSGRKFHVPMFEFQKQLPLPDEMECVVQSVDGDNLYLSQNISALLRQHYTPGQVYEFTIAEDYTRASSPHYKLTDGSGFFFKLQPPKNVKLLKNHKIRCKLRRFRGIEVDLEYLGPVYEGFSGFNVELLVRRIGIDAIRLINFYRRMDGISEVTDRYEAGSPDWLPQGVEFALDRLEQVKAGTLTPTHHEHVKSICNIMVWLLEDSDYFDNFHDADRTTRHERFRADLRRATALEKAMTIILEGSQEEYITRMIDKLDASGYLIDADLKLRVMRNVFAIDNALLTRRVESLIAVALKRKTNCMSEGALRRAFVELLQIYVDCNSSQLDSMDEAETPTAREQLNVMIRVLALQLLMADDATDEFDYRLNRSRLYRYLTLQNNAGADILLDKALNAVIACETWRNEHNWKDVEQMLTLTTCLRQEGSTASLPAVFETAQAVITVSATDISIDSSVTPDEGADCEPITKLSLWKGLGVRLDGLLPTEVRSARTIPQYKRMWLEIERRLMMTSSEPEQHSMASRRLAIPSKGEEVEIEIIGVDPSNPSRFRCKVVEDGYRGNGWIDKADITSSDRDIPYEVFTDPTGRPHVFLAEVKDMNDEEHIHFSMIDIINDYLNEGIRYENVEECVILRKRLDEATCLCRKGFVLNVKLDQGCDYLEKGDVIEVTHITVSSNGNWREGEFVAALGGRIDFLEVMSSLMADFALKDNEEDVADENDETADDDDNAGFQDASRLDEAQVREVARIIERVGASVRENRLAYNYFAYARMLALLIGDNELTDYYTKRCTLLEELDVFFTNGRVDLARLETLIPDLMKDNTALSADVEKLRILSVLDHSDNNHRLWEVFGTDANESLQELARLVLAYNMLDGFKMRDERQAIRKKLYSRLKVDIDKEPTVVAGGIENLHTEFKTSTVYPANSMRIDVAAQTLVILKVICAFMNTEGGTLYIGVSDEGYLRGLDYDLQYFGGRQDRFDRNIHDNMRSHMGFIPNLQLYFTTEWTTIDGKEIYCVKVSPIYEPVAVDGVYYYREGSSCVMVRPDDEERFITSRRELGQKRGAALREIVGGTADNQAAAAITDRPTAPRPLDSGHKLHIASSVLRNNVLHDGFEGYSNVCTYLYIYDGLSFEVTDYDKWMEDSTALTLGLHPAECEADLVVVSSDGYVARMSVGALADSDRRFSSKLRPLFISPAAEGDALIMIYRDSSGGTFKKMFGLEDVRPVKVEERGALIARDIDEVVFCEVVSAEQRALFKTLESRKQRIGKDDESIAREKSTILSRITGA